MQKQRVLVLVHETLVPPETLEGIGEEAAAEYRTEYDVVSCLRESGHDVRPIGIGDSLTELRATIQDWQPQVCFNLLEEFGGIVTYDQHVVAYLELLRQSYTGCNPRGMMLSRDKVLSKQILAYHRIPTPHFAVFRRGPAIRIPKMLRFPLFVKSATEDASLGIAQASIVEDAPRVARTHRVHPRAHAVRCAGRGIHRGTRTLRRRARQRAHPHADALGIHLRRADGARRDRDAQGQMGPRIPEAARHHERQGGGPPGRARREDSTASRVRIYRALHMTGYARIDFRVRADGTPFVLEANANPNLEREEDFADAALHDGIPYPALLGRLISLGRGYRAEWRED